MRFFAIASFMLLLISCSGQKKQEFAGDSLVAPSSNKSAEQTNVESLTEESDTLDIQDSCIVAYEPTATQQQQLLKAAPDCEEALADFEFYTGSLADSLHGSLPVHYTSSRYWRVKNNHGSELHDTKLWINRIQAKDIGVAFLRGAKKPYVMTNVATNVDYYQVIAKEYGIHIVWNPNQDSTQ